MKLAEYLDNLDPELAAKLEEAVRAVREEFDDKLSATIQAAVTAAAEEAAARAAAEPPAPAAEAIEAPSMSFDAADELRMATLDIDAAGSQAEILEALCRGILRFASRVAIFVNRGEEAHGWSASGFGDADATFKNVVLSGNRLWPEGADSESGALALNAQHCTTVAEAMGSEPPAMGLLLPFVLGSQVVGTVYCDRIGNDPFSVSALQLLTYIAGQTLETLPVRKRSSTATLSLAGSDAVEEVTTPPVQPEAPPEIEIEPEPEVEAEPEVEVAPEPEPTVSHVEPYLEPEPSIPSDFEAEGSATVELPSLSSPAAMEPSPAAAQALTEEAPALDSELPPMIDEEESTRPGLESPTLEAKVEVPPPAPTGPSVIDLGSTEVAPPEDLEGPGWAFTTTTAPNEASSESDHEDAQRLARLLVTEIKLYNEEAVEEGRRTANVYARLREDIDRSRQIFEDRIDESVRSGNDYFKQALVRILAGGDPSLLGI